MRTLRPYRAARYCFSACGLELGAARHTDSTPITSGTDGGSVYALRNAIQSLSDLVGVVHGSVCRLLSPFVYLIDSGTLAPFDYPLRRHF